MAELKSLHVLLGEWLAAAEAATVADSPPDEEVEAVRDALTSITRERRERQADERRDS